MAEVGSEVVRHALKTAREFGFRSVTLRQGEFKFSAVMDPDAEPESASLDLSEANAAVEMGPLTKEITSPCVGYFGNGSEPLKVGGKVTSGAIVGVVQAVGLDNDVVSKAEGEVVEVLVKDGDPVEYGQVLAKVKVSS
ncbi:MAG: biotin/lipoyl-binding protein [Chthonomonas sp.]|nr:biotin/lipoyl-binding protein [Chthonomonas sp.]